jgi:hypothetical protein
MYDPRCYDLAADFLEDEDVPPRQRAALAAHLAQTIQNAIEAEIEDLRIMFARELDGIEMGGE